MRVRLAGRDTRTESTMPIMHVLKNLITRLLGKNGVKKWRGTEGSRLQKLCLELNRFNVATEQEFLTIGGYLQDFSGQAQEISQAAAATAGIVGGQEMKKAIGELDDIFQQTKLLEGECEKGTDVLSEIIKILDMIQAAIIAFMKIVKTLVVLGTFIRVESARLGSMGADFLTLADEISQLGRSIEDKCKNIFDKSQSLSSSLTSSLSNVLKIKASQQGQIHDVIDKTMVSLHSLMERQNLASATAEQISESYRNISVNISNIVMSLQFHDITRQQIEHVDKALQNVVTLTENVDQKNGRQEQALRQAQHICRIQAAQLGIARDKLTQAVGAIMDNLISIAGDIDAITQQVQELAGDASQAGKSFLVEMEDHLAAVTGGLNLYGAARHDLLGLMQAVAPAIGEMASFLVDIERIEIAIERIALNACVKAAHLGKEGTALGVLAEAAQSLVGDTRQQTQAVSASLKSIKDAARQLSSGAGVDEEQVEVDVGTLVTDLGAILKTLDRLNKNVIGALGQVDQKGKKLAAGLSKAGGDITVHEYAGEVLDHVIIDIQDLEQQFTAQLPEKYKAAELSPEELESLKLEYTMVDERKVHDQIMTSASTPVTQEILGIDNDNNTVTVAEEKDEEGNFGDNVELF
jgi:hypothetical protein